MERKPHNIFHEVLIHEKGSRESSDEKPMNFVLGWCKNRCWKLLAIHSAPPDFRKPAVCCRVKVRFARNVLGGKHQARLGPPSSHPPIINCKYLQLSHGQNWGVTYRG